MPRPTLYKRIILHARQHGRCCYCEKEIDLAKTTLEHLKRKEEGGTRAWDNVAMACKPCNSGRGTVDWLTWKSYKMGELSI